MFLLGLGYVGWGGVGGDRDAGCTFSQMNIHIGTSYTYTCTDTNTDTCMGIYTIR